MHGVFFKFLFLYWIVEFRRSVVCSLAVWGSYVCQPMGTVAVFGVNTCASWSQTKQQTQCPLDTTKKGVLSYMFHFLHLSRMFCQYERWLWFSAAPKLLFSFVILWENMRCCTGQPLRVDSIGGRWGVLSHLLGSIPPCRGARRMCSEGSWRSTGPCLERAECLLSWSPLAWKGKTELKWAKSLIKSSVGT